MTTNQVNPETGEIHDLPTEWERKYSDEAAIHQYSFELEKLEVAKAKVGRWEQELMRRATESGATTIYGQGMNFVIETKNETDWSKMPPVLEFLTPEEKLEAFKPEHTITVPEHIIPEHEETIPAKWAVKGTVMKLLRRHGDEAIAAADPATFPGKTTGKLIKT